MSDLRLDEATLEELLLAVVRAGVLVALPKRVLALSLLRDGLVDATNAAEVLSTLCATTSDEAERVRAVVTAALSARATPRPPVTAPPSEPPAQPPRPETEPGVAIAVVAGVVLLGALVLATAYRSCCAPESSFSRGEGSGDGSAIVGGSNLVDCDLQNDPHCARCGARSPQEFIDGVRRFREADGSADEFTYDYEDKYWLYDPRRPSGDRWTSERYRRDLRLWDGDDQHEVIPPPPPDPVLWPWRALAIAALLLAALSLFAGWWRNRRFLWSIPEPGDDDARLGLPDVARSWLSDAERESIAAASARAAAEVVSPRLDVRATVLATTRRAGIPTPVFEPEVHDRPLHVIVDGRPQGQVWVTASRELLTSIEASGGDVRRGRFRRSLDAVDYDGREQSFADAVSDDAHGTARLVVTNGAWGQVAAAEFDTIASSLERAAPVAVVVIDDDASREHLARRLQPWSVAVVSPSGVAAWLASLAPQAGESALGETALRTWAGMLSLSPSATVGVAHALSFADLVDRHTGVRPTFRHIPALFAQGGDSTATQLRLTEHRTRWLSLLATQRPAALADALARWRELLGDVEGAPPTVSVVRVRLRAWVALHGRTDSADLSASAEAELREIVNALAALRDEGAAELWRGTLNDAGRAAAGGMAVDAEKFAVRFRDAATDRGLANTLRLALREGVLMRPANEWTTAGAALLGSAAFAAALSLFSVAAEPPPPPDPPPEKEGEAPPPGHAWVFIRIPAGEFCMGSPDDEGGRWGDGREGPVHRVRISHDFLIAETETTRAQWEAVGADADAGFGGEGETAVVHTVNDTESIAACALLEPPSIAAGVGLPSEAMWEYAARAGTTTRFAFGDDDADLGEYAWHSTNSGVTPHAAASTPRSVPLGLYDIHGNLWEWVADAYEAEAYAGRAGDADPAGSGVAVDPFVRDSPDRVVRGGSWSNEPWDLRSAYRSRYRPVNRSDDLGFRCASSPPRAAVAP